LTRLLEVDARVSYLREKYKSSTLKIDIEEATERPDSLNSYLFVRQVRAVKVGEERLRNAQRDFLKASAQRSKWLREARIDPAELDKYDQILEERWSTQAAKRSSTIKSTGENQWIFGDGEQRAERRFEHSTLAHQQPHLAIVV
jgi:hypothetical protein